MNNYIFYVLSLSYLLLFTSCNKNDVVNFFSKDNLIIEDERSIKNKNMIDLYTDLKYENLDFISIQTNNSLYSCINDQQSTTLLTASFRELNKETNVVSSFKVAEIKQDLRYTHGYFNPDQSELKNTFGTNVDIAVYNNDEIIAQKNIYINKPFCPLYSRSFNEGDKTFYINQGDDIVLNWEADPKNNSGIAFALTNNTISSQTNKAFIKIVDDNGSTTLPFSEIKDYRTISVGVFSEDELEINNKKVSLVVLHFTTFALIVNQ